MNHRFTSFSRIPFVTLSIAVVAAITASSARLQHFFQLDQCTTDGSQLYRLVTCHLTHWTTDHLVWDLTVFLVLGTLCERTSRVRFVACLVAAAFAISLSMELVQPGEYRGLSGIDSALLTWLAASLLLREDGWPRWLAATLVAGFLAKSGFELVSGRSLFVDSHADGFALAPLAHLVGAGVGAAFGAGKCNGCEPLPRRTFIRASREPLA